MVRLDLISSRFGSKVSRKPLNKFMVLENSICKLENTHTFNCFYLDLRDTQRTQDPNSLGMGIDRVTDLEGLHTHTSRLINVTLNIEG